MSKRKYEEAETVADATHTSSAQKKAKQESSSERHNLSKEERKALKRAQKLAAEAHTNSDEDKERKRRKAEKKAKKLAAGAQAQADNDIPTRSTEDAATKSARKAAKKAAKAAKQGNGIDTTASTSPTNGASLTSSVVPSQMASSATSPEPSTSSYTPRVLSEGGDDSAYLKDNQITINEDSSMSVLPLAPITSFSQLPAMSEEEKAPFATFKAPTPIQAAAWPYLLASRDVIGVAETGSGKTWAFGVPCIRYIKALPKNKRRGVKAVIVSPTRELALQIEEQLVKLAGPAKLHIACLYGGVDKVPQRDALKKASIIVATPGRLNDFVEEGAADLSGAQFVVLDEADRMLDKGFEDAVRQIISATATERQTLMFTATWPESVRKLASTFMKAPVKIIIGDNTTGELRANTRIEQRVEVIAPYDKNGRMIQILREHQSGSKKNDRILIFCLYKKEAQRVHDFLGQKGFKVAGIHGDMSQSQRISNLEEFKSGRSTLLVATDVAARGLDIPAVKVVLNVTFPLTAEDYVHRIGRTGRAGQSGLAITLFTEHDKGLSGALVNVLRAANQPIPDALLKFGTAVKKKEHAAYGAFYKEIDSNKKATKITFD